MKHQWLVMLNLVAALLLMYVALGASGWRLVIDIVLISLNLIVAVLNGCIGWSKRYG